VSEGVVEEESLLNQFFDDGESKRSDNKDLFAGRKEDKDTKANNRKDDDQGDKIFARRLDRGKIEMKNFVEGNHERLDEVQGAVGLRKIVLSQKHKIDRLGNMRHEAIEKMEVRTLKPGFENAIEHEDDDYLDYDIDYFGDDCSGALAHDFFGFLCDFYRVVGKIVFEPIDFESDVKFVFVRARTGHVKREENEANGDRE